MEQLKDQRAGVIQTIEEIIRKANLKECLKIMGSSQTEMVRLMCLSNGNQTIRSDGSVDETKAVWEYLQKHPGTTYLPLVKCGKTSGEDRIHRTGDYLVGIQFSSVLLEPLLLEFSLVNNAFMIGGAGQTLSTIKLKVPRGVDFIPLNQLPWYYKAQTLHISSQVEVKGLPSDANVIAMFACESERESLRKLMNTRELREKGEDLTIDASIGLEAVRIIESLITRANIQGCLEIMGELKTEIPRINLLSADNLSISENSLTKNPQLAEDISDQLEEARKDVREYFQKNPGKPYIPMTKLPRRQHVTRQGDFLVGILFDSAALESTTVTFTLVGSFNRVLSSVNFVIEKGTTFYPLNRLPWHYKAASAQIYSRVFCKGLPSNASLVSAHLNDDLRKEVSKLHMAKEFYQPGEHLYFSEPDDYLYCGMY
jgi:hypothetical protein